MLKQLRIGVDLVLQPSNSINFDTNVYIYLVDSRTMSVRGDAGTTTDDQTNAAERRSKGEFVRCVSKARQWMSSESTYLPESGRYHLYVAYNCPCK
jgi:hypothetical protein